MNYFSEIFGLVTRSDPTTENGGLFFAHYLVLKLMLGMPITKDDYYLFQSKMENAHVSWGLYLRSKHHKERTVSHDELTGFFVSSHVLKTSHRFQIWKRLVSELGNYPATGENKYYNPASLYAWAILADSKLSPLLAPLYTVNLLISTNKNAQKVSSKLIYLTELFIMKDKSFYASILWKYYKWRMEKMYGERWIKSIYHIYFGQEPEDHPLRQLSEKL